MKANRRTKGKRTAKAILAAAVALAVAGFVGTAPSEGPGEQAASSTTAEASMASQGDGSSDGTSDAASENTNAGTLIVRFIDVGQGDCALVTFGNESLLIDGGPSKASSKVYSILESLGIKNLDAIIATHPDADHIGGIAGALNYASCSSFYCSVASHDTKTFQSVLKYLGDTPITIPSCGDSFSLGNARVTFVGPTDSSFGAENNGSLVCRIDYGSTSFLFAGDAEEESEAAMVSAGARLGADVLKVAHHGSAHSSSTAFLNAVHPCYAVISTGENSYGHPAQSTLSRISATGAAIYRTDESGSIIFKSDGASLSIYTTKGDIGE